MSQDIFMSQEKLQTMVMQKSWGVIEVYYGIVHVVNRPRSIYQYSCMATRLSCQFCFLCLTSLKGDF